MSSDSGGGSQYRYCSSDDFLSLARQTPPTLIGDVVQLICRDSLPYALPKFNNWEKRGRKQCTDFFGAVHLRFARWEWSCVDVSLQRPESRDEVVSRPNPSNGHLSEKAFPPTSLLAKAWSASYKLPSLYIYIYISGRRKRL